MRDLLINSILKTAKSGHLIRILWISNELKSVCLFNMDTMAMLYFVERADLQD
jgi:uncharacterized protein YqgC (DUF456 family)